MIECVVERLGADQAEQISAADMLLHHHAEPIVVAAALLAPLRRRGCIERDELWSLFGEDTANLVERIFREDDFPADTGARHKEHLRSFLGSNAEDPRIAILRIGLRLAKLEKPADQNDDRRHDMAQETLELYVPLADQMGMRELCMRLEDVCFRVLEPSVYEELARNVEPIQREDAICLKLLEEGVRRLLEQNSLLSQHERSVNHAEFIERLCRQVFDDKLVIFGPGARRTRLPPLMLTHLGRKSGLPRQTIVEVVRHDKATDTYFVVSGFGEKSDWYRNIRKNPRVTVHMGGRRMDCMAEQLGHNDAVHEFNDYARRHPAALKTLSRVLRYPWDGTEASYHALAQLLPIMALRPPAK